MATEHSNPSHHRSASDADKGVAVSLPILAAERNSSPVIRKSKSGKRRAIVLATVQLLMLAHVALWMMSREYGWWGGRTATPIEPSEAMEFVKHGVINVGLIFFVLALLSTLILGRWFCGWGCHVVMLQDLCGWMMRRMGIRPKPFRSRLLIFVPLILALYMFVWPVFYRLAIAPWTQPDLQWPGFSVQLTTTELWQSMPGALVAILFLFTCGFAAVYFLGAKGFCTYGCPYGGFFAPVDEFAVGRIRVTDACEHCGHCTTVCTSNVRVHEEVREYGMVVDPGCMKCLDCVSVCPNDALYFGFGRPAQIKGPARTKAPKRTYDLTWRQEIGLAVVFLVVFLSVRGVYGLIPMLMAAGLAGVVTFLVWMFWCLWSKPNVRLHRFQLKYKGTLRSSGWIFAGLVVLVMVLTAHSGVVSGTVALAKYHAKQVTMPQEVVFSGSPVRMPDEMTDHADRALRFYRLAASIGEGGIGLSSFWQSELDIQMAKLLSAKLDFTAAEALLRHVVERDGRSEVFCSSLAWVLRAQRRFDEAMAYYTEILSGALSYDRMLDDYVRFCSEEGRQQQAIDVCRHRLELDPDNLHTMRWLSLLLFDTGQLDEGIQLVRDTIDIDPTSPGAFATLASALARRGHGQDAYDAMTRALELAPQNHLLYLQMAGLLRAIGRGDEAQTYLDQAAALQSAAGGDDAHAPPRGNH